MEVFFVTEETPNGVNYVGAALSAIRARQMFDSYLNAMEKFMREQDGELNQNNTYNRFSEATNDYLLYAVLGESNVFVKRIEAE
jgi:hypothetical protein